MRAACLSAFINQVKEKKCDAFYVRINKNLTIGEKRQAMAAVRKKWDETRESHPGLSDSELRVKIIRTESGKP